MLVPESVSLPPASVKPPVPEMTPEKDPEALDRVRDWLPKLTVPEPASEVICGVLVAADTSKIALSVRPLEAAMLLPLPDSANVPDEIVVGPA